jgi:type IV pilus assembly protein PilV
MKRLILNSCGFSLIEVLIAMVLLAIGLLGLAGMQSTAISGNSFAHSGTVAIQIGEEMIDRIRANAGVNPELYDGIDTTAGCNAFVAPAINDCTDWLVVMQRSQLQNPRGLVTVVANTPLENTATISVTVIWGRGTGARNITFTTILETWGT